jgi:hypothetical protein
MRSRYDGQTRAAFGSGFGGECARAGFGGAWVFGVEAYVFGRLQAQGCWDPVMAQ